MEDHGRCPLGSGPLRGKNQLGKLENTEPDLREDSQLGTSPIQPVASESLQAIRGLESEDESEAVTQWVHVFIQSLTDQSKKLSAEEAFSKILEFYQNKLFRFCMRLCRERALAEDICQEAFVKVYTQITELEDASKFKSWLFQIAYRLFIDQMRKKKVRGRESTIDQPDSTMEKLQDADRSSISMEEKMAVRSVLEKMDEQDRSLLILVDVEEFSYGEAAEVLKITENALRSRVHRARKVFLEILKKS